MRRERVHPFHSGVVAAALLAVIMVAVVVSGIPGGPQIPLPWNRTETLHVQLADADALEPHASVEIGGVKVGEVQSVVAGGSYALATLQVQQQYADIHSNATVYLRAHGLFGPKYIAIVPGTASAPVLQDGATILVDQTVQPVDLSDILQDLQAPEQQNLRTFFVELGTAAVGRGDDVNHLLAVSDELSKVLQSPLVAADQVAPQLSDMLVKDEQFNNYFAQTPLDKLVANSEQTVQAFASNAAQLQSLLSNANQVLGQLDTALGGESGNLARIIQQLGEQGGTLDRLAKFEYLLGLFGENLTGVDKSDPADANVVQGIIGAVENVKSAFYYADPCPVSKSPVPGSADDNHCSVSPDGLAHFLHVRVYNFAPGLPNLPSLPSCLPVIIPGLPQQCLPSPLGDTVGNSPAQYAGEQLSSFGALIAS
ncbi:MAG: MCE family protein [Candidatus Dormibacteraeota bacterium]|nr:MCE family protein [Candidatus Dormibacteraeota bacterium]